MNEDYASEVFAIVNHREIINIIDIVEFKNFKKVKSLK